MQRAASASLKARPIEKDASSVDDSGVAAGGIGKDTAFGRCGVVLEARRLQCGRQGADQVRLVFVVEFCADRATTLAEFGGRFRQDPEAAATPNAGTVRGEERAVEPPSGVTVRSR